MSDDVTQRLAEIEARANQATRGPWYAFNPYIGYDCGECTCGQGPNSPYGHEGQCGLEQLGKFDGADVDREFIAHAREDVTWLAERLRTWMRLLSLEKSIHDDLASQATNAEATITRVRKVIESVDARHHGQHSDEFDSECFACWRDDLLRALDGGVPS